MSKKDPILLLCDSDHPIEIKDENSELIQQLKESLQIRENQIQELKTFIKEQNERLDSKLEQLVDIMIQRYK